jgi:hypothetical protein
MGGYVNVVAKPGCASQINELWARAFNKQWLVYTAGIIESEINYIANDSKQKHLLWVNTVEKWNKAFPIAAEGKGQVFIRAYGYSDEAAQAFSQSNKQLRNKITWLMDHRFLFQSISGLQDAVDTLDMDIDCDALENGRKVIRKEIMFENLPVETNNRVYKLCLTYNNPTLWQKFITWRDDPNWDAWSELRHCVVPGQAMDTIWQRVEDMAKDRDKVNYGLVGKYQQGLIPPETDVLRAIA